MSGQSEFLFWWGIVFIALIGLGVIGTMLFNALGERRAEKEDKRTHRRTWEKP